ncbi:UNVERIFIED_CONTAM: hypothetical protein FKN15_008298 [Acipenser sinensis]
MVPGTSPAHERAPATSHGVKAACQTVPDTSPAIAEPKRPRVVSQRLAKWSLAPPQCAHWDQRLSAGCQRLARCARDLTRGASSSPKDPWHHPSTRTGTGNFALDQSGLPNGPWHHPSMCTGPSDFARDPRGSPNGPWHIPSARTATSDFALGKSGLPNSP